MVITPASLIERFPQFTTTDPVKLANYQTIINEAYALNDPCFWGTLYEIVVLYTAAISAAEEAKAIQTAGGLIASRSVSGEYSIGYHNPNGSGSTGRPKSWFQEQLDKLSKRRSLGFIISTTEISCLPTTAFIPDEPDPGNNEYQTTFTNSSLTGVYYNVNHNLGTFPSGIVIYNNLGQRIDPDGTANISTNTLQIDLSSFIPLSGIWIVSVTA